VDFKQKKSVLVQFSDYYYYYGIHLTLNYVVIALTAGSM
jgi:hypothetical protein